MWCNHDLWPGNSPQFNWPTLWLITLSFKQLSLPAELTSWHLLRRGSSGSHFKQIHKREYSTVFYDPQAEQVTGSEEKFEIRWSPLLFYAPFKNFSVHLNLNRILLLCSFLNTITFLYKSFHSSTKMRRQMRKLLKLRKNYNPSKPRYIL